MSFNSVYRRYLKSVAMKAQRIRLRRQFIYEWYELFTKERKAVSAGKLTQEEKQAIRAYWKEQGYEKVPLFWHSKYKAYSGKLDVRYYPEYLYTTKLEPLMNSDAVSSVLQDKNLIEFLYSKVLTENHWIMIPQTYGGCSAGNYFNKDREPVAKAQLLAALADLTADCVIKPAVGENSGHGVRVLTLENGIDKKSGQQLEKIIDGYGKDFIIQERFVEHKDWAVFNPSSLNTVRIITYRVGGAIHATDAIMRIGRSGSHLDNAHAGGMYIAVHQDGSMGEFAHIYGFGNHFCVHPDTGVCFAEHRLPGMDKIREAAIKLHSCLPAIGFVNWDFVLDEEENAVLIESNLCCGGIWVIQNAHGTGIFGDDTPEMIKAITKHA